MITKILTEIVQSAFEKCGYDKKLGIVTISDRWDLCQFQCNGAFSGAKLYKKAPFIIANEIANELLNNEIFNKVEVANPGFINITLKDEYLIKTALGISKDKNIGVPQADTPETIVLDYGGPNVAKPLHIGHLRSAIIGEALKRLLKASGRKVISDVHLGDWGLQIGLVIAELEERNPDWKCFSDEFNSEMNFIPNLSAETLNEIYPYASKKSKENENFKEKAKLVTSQLQNGKPGYIALWKEIIRISIEDLKKNYTRLNIDFDLWYGESDANKYINTLIQILTDKNLLYKSEGAMVVDVSEDTDKVNIPPIIIKKSDDSSIYGTTDLATIIQRQQDFSPNKIWYVVDNRQSLHLTQVFRCAKKAEIVPNTTELEHLSFGTMNGTDGKPYKTRDGGVMQLSDLLDTIINAAIERISFSDEQSKYNIAEKIGVAAIKFGDLINHRSKDYIFDIDKFLSSEGKTGVYLLYTIARINSILKKANCSDDNIVLNNIYTDLDRELLLKIIFSSESFMQAINEKAPNFICENAYQIATAFSKFYHDNHILSETDTQKQNTWIGLCLFTKKMLIKHLDILGIESVELM